MKIGFFGGSFNPPTKAHIDLANKALKECLLDKVIFVPMSDFYIKDGLIKAEDRINMLKIVCQDNSRLDVSDLEIKLNKKMETIDAFRLIEENYLGEELFFIMGADNFVKILNWKDSEELVSKYKYIVFERKDIELINFIDENLREYRRNIQIIENNEYKDTCSSEFRKDKSSFKDTVSKEVFKYIEKNAIY